MFSKLLIANRGEIALRIARTCDRLGIATVAVYSDADRDAPHVVAAGEAVYLGPAAPAASYLSVEGLLDAAAQTGAEALHPGYGFLSERAELAEACARAGLVYIGPPAEATRRLGDKIGARRLARAVEVPVVPGYDGDAQDEATLAREAASLRFPLMIKAAAGGGGRGMRRVERPGDFSAALAAAKAEALQAFGDDRVLLERLVEPARHVEAQLLADAHGVTLAVGDRDCSIQRRHQKLIEEAPAPDLSPAVRDGLRRAAERLAAAAGYRGAGTAEFLVDRERYYFLELNARLQVEHTVTEMVTGIDLVEWQLRLAAGERLALTADALVPRGHAVQARVYAEDPARGFLPGAGTVWQLRWPRGAGVRVDASITAAGQSVPAAYDPLVGKVIAWGSTRAEALARADAALADTVILGVPCNVAFLRRVLGHPQVRRGPVPTTFLSASPELLREPDPSAEARAAVGRARLTGPAAWQALAGWRQGAPAHASARRTVALEHEGKRLLVPLPTTLVSGEGDQSGGETVVLPVRAGGRQGWEVSHGGARWLLWSTEPVPPPVAISPAAAGAGALPPRGGSAPDLRAPGNWLVGAPLPGKITQVMVTEGEEVAAGAAVAALEAMKMQHALTSDRPGRVVRLLVAPGAVVRLGQAIMELEPR